MASKSHPTVPSPPHTNILQLGTSLKNCKLKSETEISLSMKSFFAHIPMDSISHPTVSGFTLFAYKNFYFEYNKTKQEVFLKKIIFGANRVLLSWHKE